MITINLLSPSQKRELKIKRVYVAVKELIILVLLFTLIIAILLLISKYVLDNSLARLIERNAYSIAENREVINKINTLNSKIITVDKIQKDFKKWSNFFIIISEITPNNISYDLVKISYQDKSIEIKGVAKNRGDLTKLKDNLISSGLFEDINLPLKDLLAKDNNTFSITAKIILDKIK
ncbi:PilN domain-containing protein [Candidatus Falkowbacteria bacterium]|uniref:PilN domain-containing protein n=1 Tax=Candidatus Buchananbacteria bacterium CG10_big_fil_rev_8_21_14_0_10_33_19 TaxID=1974525 RepID=A0A2H0W4A5_9BACT|nr:PilN domain-containing protein [Candidatus Falkowbacteria bacterium]PIS06183.1 MAG: hypothetical protein COT80_01260 [Candidatus Buchananbacteria bacterium CG10_big_fil_rev_8_21_14_0_10_33_19]